MTRTWNEENLPGKVTQHSNKILMMQVEVPMWEAEKTPEELNEDGLPVLAA